MRLSEVKTESDNLTNFISLMKKYTEFKELTQEILYSFVNRIEIGEKEKFSHNTQKNKNHLQLHRCGRHPAGITPNIAFSKVNKPWEKVSRRKANEFKNIQPILNIITLNNKSRRRHFPRISRKLTICSAESEHFFRKLK